MSMTHTCTLGKFSTSTRRGKATVNGNTVYVTVDNFRNYANAKGFFCYAHDGNVTVNNTQPVTTANYTRYVTAKIGLNIRRNPNGSIIGSYKYGTVVTVLETSGNWSRTNLGWVSSDYLGSYTNTVSTQTSTATKVSKSYRTGNYKVTASVLNVRYGAGTRYKAKTYKQLTANARNQNRRLGNYYANGYKRGVVCTVTRISGNWGYTASGWICLDYCSKL